MSSASSGIDVLRGPALADGLAAAHDGHVVGDVEHLAQLVRDQDDGRALRLERAQHAEQLLGLLRREHGGRLVEDQDLRAVVERLEDLDPLLLADRQVLDLRRRDRRAGRALGELLTSAIARARMRKGPWPAPWASVSVLGDVTDARA
jgi:hypothetical protein